MMSDTMKILWSTEGRHGGPDNAYVYEHPENGFEVRVRYANSNSRHACYRRTKRGAINAAWREV